MPSIRAGTQKTTTKRGTNSKERRQAAILPLWPQQSVPLSRLCLRWMSVFGLFVSSSSSAAGGGGADAAGGALAFAASFVESELAAAGLAFAAAAAGAAAAGKGGAACGGASARAGEDSAVAGATVGLALMACGPACGSGWAVTAAPLLPERNPASPAEDRDEGAILLPDADAGDNCDPPSRPAFSTPPSTMV